MALALETVLFATYTGIAEEILCCNRLCSGLYRKKIALVRAMLEADVDIDSHRFDGERKPTIVEVAQLGNFAFGEQLVSAGADLDAVRGYHRLCAIAFSV